MHSSNRKAPCAPSRRSVLSMARRQQLAPVRIAWPGLALAALAACGGVEPDAPTEAPVPAAPGWQLVFSDEFDGAALDTNKWNIQTGDGCPDLCGWGNNELQTYTAGNIEVSGGVLNLVGRRESDGSFSSARINTRGKFDFRYGRVEVSARIPSGQGIWPAIWMLASEPEIYGPWPYSGELDIMEAFNYGVGDNRSVFSTTHYGLPTPPFNGTSSRTELAVAADVNFHTYALEWEQDRLRFFIDGQHFQSQNSDNWFAFYPADENGVWNPWGAYRPGPDSAPFDREFHLLLNFAIGGNPVGYPAESTLFPQSFAIDHVRVYQCANGDPETGAGCGVADRMVTPLEDHDGGPLEHAETAMPYVSSMDLYVNGPETIVLELGEQQGSNTLEVGGYVGPGAAVTNDPAAADPGDPANTAWHFAVAGDVANIFLASQDLSNDELLATGFDFSGDAVGEVVFDMRVNSIDPTTRLLVKLDSGWPNLGEVAVPRSELRMGGWKTYSAKFSDFVANPGFVECCGGTGVDLANVVNPFVFEVAGGAADVHLDNIRVSRACYVVGACKAQPKAGRIPDFVVFDDAVNRAVWDRGIVASDSGVGWADYTDPFGTGNKAHWRIVNDPDPSRGQTLEVTFNDSTHFGVWFIQSSSGVNMSAFDAGAVEFDIIVDDYGTNTSGMTMKIDCIFPCTSGDKNLGTIADGVWETVSVPVSSLTRTGLDLNQVNTGIVIFPTAPQSGGIRYRLDNIRWVGESEAPPLNRVNLPVTFDDPGVDYLFTDFGGSATQVVADPTDPANNVASTFKGEGAETWAGVIVGGDNGFATAIPFTSAATTLSLRVFAPAANLPIMLKVEDAADPNIFAEVVARTSVANAWETLTFDFLGQIDPTNIDYEKAVLFPNFGNPGDGSTWYWDDLVFGGGAAAMPTQVDLPVTFDDASIDYSVGDFGGASTQIVAEPDNAANNVASTFKGEDAQTWAGTTIGTEHGFATRLPVSADSPVLTVRVRSPEAGIPVLLKAENAADGGISVETLATTTVADTWETLSFDFRNHQAGTAALDSSAVYEKLSIFFNFGAPGAGRNFLWDDIRVGDADTLPAAGDAQGVFDDTVDPRWELGLVGTEGPGWGLITDGAAGNEVNWTIVDSDDSGRGKVIQATFGGGTEPGLIYAGTESPADLSGFADGNIVFDVRVTDYGASPNGLGMKIDCVFPCTSGDRLLGLVGDGVWETITVPVSQLVDTGLNLATVNTGIVVFPWIPDQQAGHVVSLQLDNVRWEP